MMITYTKDNKTGADLIIIACEKEEKRQHRKKDWESSEMILSIPALNSQAVKPKNQF